MKRIINFKKDKNKNYIFQEEKSKNKLVINSTEKILSAQELYDAFFKNSKFNINDSFELHTNLKKLDRTDNHIFDKMKCLFKEIEKNLNDNLSNEQKNNEINNTKNK